MLPSELHCSRHGLRYVSAEEINANKRFVLRHISSQENFHRPLNSYQDDKNSLSLSELVRARHEDEMQRLKEEYQDFFKFPESRFYKSYLRRQKEMERDYKNQEKWVHLYQEGDSEPVRNVFLTKLQMLNSALLFGAGTLAAVSRSPLAPVTTTLFYVGAMANFYVAYQNYQQFQTVPQSKEQIRMILEDWYEPDPFARYNRAILNNKLQQLDKTSPSQKRRAAKYELVHQYRAKHPKER